MESLAQLLHLLRAHLHSRYSTEQVLHVKRRSTSLALLGAGKQRLRARAASLKGLYRMETRAGLLCDGICAMRYPPFRARSGRRTVLRLCTWVEGVEAGLSLSYSLGSLLTRHRLLHCLKSRLHMPVYSNHAYDCILAAHIQSRSNLNISFAVTRQFPPGLRSCQDLTSYASHGIIKIVQSSTTVSIQGGVGVFLITCGAPKHSANREAAARQVVVAITE